MADLINLTALKSPTIILPSISAGVIRSVVEMSNITLGTQALSGALTSNTYKEMISLSVPGWIRLCGVYVVDATSRTIGLKIVIDGTTALDEVSGTIATTSTGIYGVGYGYTSTASNIAAAALELFRFNASLVISIKSSVSETDKLTLLYLTAV